jgi:hypothetical protein
VWNDEVVANYSVTNDGNKGETSSTRRRLRNGEVCCGVGWHGRGAFSAGHKRASATILVEHIYWSSTG